MSVIDRAGSLGVPLFDSAFAAAGTRRRDWQVRYRLASLGLDVLCGFSVSLAVGYYAAPGSTALIGLVGAVAFVAGSAASGGYAMQYAAPVSREYRTIGAGFLAMLLVAMTVSFLGIAELAPAPVLLGATGATVTAALLRTAQRRVMSSFRARGLFRPRAMIVGSAEHVSGIAADLREGRRDLDVLGACVPGQQAGEVLDDGIAVLGGTLAAATTAEDLGVDVVLLSTGVMEADESRRFQWAVERAGIQFVMVPHISEVLSNRLDVQVVGASPMVTLLQPSHSQRLAKQLIDRVLGGILLVAFSPVILAAMVGVAVTSPGSSLFRQVRIGYDGRPFTMLKLRTMVADAESRREELLDASTGAGPLFKMTVDPRVTPLGRILRRFSIDELPQLWNVVRGDMSLVGPRPPLPSEVAAYDSMAMHRLNVKPGLTGLWQVSGRSDLSWEQSIKLDLRYVDNWSVGYDLQILWRTAKAVLGADGAY